jgi:hypothetical protein
MPTISTVSNDESSGERPQAPISNASAAAAHTPTAGAVKRFQDLKMDIILRS